MTTATVVGSGPNGLAAAVALAREGVDVTVLEAASTVGGGTRTAELTLPGLRHDVCSAIHPFAAASPFFTSLGLERHGLRWCQPPVDLAHPLDGGRARLMLRSLDDTVAGLGDDGATWRRLFGPVAAGFDDLMADLFRPILHVPRHPAQLARFGLRALPPATLLARTLRTEEGRALFAGIAAHAIQPLARPTTPAAGVMLIAAAHRVGWPVPAGGAQAVADALVAALVEHGGRVETGVRVRSLDEVRSAGAVLLDLAPSGVLALAGDLLPARVRRAYRRYRHGPAAYKVDLAVEGGVPWANDDCRRAGTVHVGGTLADITASEREVHRGRLPERPFVLVAQQHVADPSRSRGDVHPVWSYAHVPNGYAGDATDLVIDQIERYAPGLRERIVGMHVRQPADIERDNPNFVGGDVITGATDPWQVVIRPRLARDPYATGIPGVFICSAATPPGTGVHGMCGANAAATALRYLRRHG